MSDKRYEANIIRTTAVEPANNLESTSAPGVWSIDEVVELQKKNKWPTVGNVATDVSDVFSTFLYEGTGSNQTITNGIALGPVTTEVALTGKTITNLGSSFESSYPLSNVNDGTVETVNAQNVAYTTGTFDIYVDMGSAVIIDAYFLAPQGNQGGSANNAPTGFTVSGSNNTSSWTTIETFSGISGFSPGAYKTFEFTNTTSYRYYRLAVTNTGVSVSEWKVRTSDGTGEGGLVWIKGRNATSDHALVDTVRGGSNSVASNTTAAQRTDGAYGVTFNSNGFTSTGGNLNVNGREQVSWTFRKAPKFFDIVTWTGTGSSRTISHNLGSVPGMIIIKCTSHTGNWSVWHRSVTSPNSNWWRNYGILQSTMAWADWGNDTGLSSEPTSTAFSLGSGLNDINASGRTYVAYLFAHNNNDGEFGPDQDADIIKCGSYTTDSNEDATIDLGFEPQFVMFKRTDSSTGGDWSVYDAMRGMQGDFLSQAALLEWNTSDAEDATTNRIAVTPTGFKVDNYGASRSYIYMAIRRGPLAQPTSATNVFAISTNGQAGDSKAPAYRSTFPVDMYFEKSTGSSSWYISSRLTGSKYMSTNANSAEATDSNLKYDFMNGVYDSTGSNSAYYGWMWKRAPGYFDVVAYTGNGTVGRTVSHNLGVAPEMMVVKRRDDSHTYAWATYVEPLGAGRVLFLERSDTGLSPSDTSPSSNYFWGDGSNPTAPTSDVFTLGTNERVNASGGTYIAYLFATVAGVSKVGSYTGTGSAQNIDCGFSSGAKFVIIKRTDSADDWHVFDTTRGIVSGNDPYMALNDSGSQITSQDYVDPYSSGFAVTGENPVGGNGGTYLFYAIAT